MAPTTSKPSKVNPIDIATNEALLAYADATRLAKSWLSVGAKTQSNPDHDTGAATIEDEQQDDQEFKNFTQEGYSENGGIGFVNPAAAGTAAAAGGSSSSSFAGVPGSSTSFDAATSFLRTQMLGKSAGRNHSRITGRPGQNQHNTHNPIARPQKRHGPNGRGGAYDDDDDPEGGEEEESRSRLGTAKSKSKSKSQSQSQSQSGPNRKPGDRHAQMQREDHNPGAEATTTSTTPPLPPPAAETPEATNKPATTNAAEPQPTAATAAVTSSAAPPVRKRAAKTSYLDELLAQREAKRSKKQNQQQKKLK